MGNIGAGELIFIAVFALLIFGPKRLPEIGRSVGRALAEVRKATNELKDGFTSGFEDFNFNREYRELRELKGLATFDDLNEPLILNGPVKATRVTNQTAPTPPPNHPNEQSVSVQPSPPDPVEPVGPVGPSNPALLGAATEPPAGPQTGPPAGDPPSSTPDRSTSPASEAGGVPSSSPGEDGASQR
jgi:TatA/E family protein of Tat protein translocase